MDTLGTFLKKRYLRTLLFATPVIFSCGIVGIIGNEILGITLVLITTLSMGIVIIVRKPLPGPLGKWQNLWNSIPSWSQYHQDLIAQRKEEKTP